MLEFIFYFGSGCISNILFEKFGNLYENKFFDRILRIVSFSLLNTSILILALKLFNRLTICQLANGFKLVIGGSAVVLITLISIFTGFLVYILNKRISIDVKIEERVETDEK